MDGFSDKLRAVLNDPESMAKITEIARGFAEKKPSAEPPSTGEKAEPPPPDPMGELLHSPAIAEALRLLGNGSRERVALLQAMRPFVKEEKKEKLDKIIGTMKTLDLLTSAQKLL
ncbi:MAG: hypothetical protein IJC26_04930 [Clostridia bacterium]|nr:hypothetical protein [Clostridia bacterium]